MAEVNDCLVAKDPRISVQETSMWHDNLQGSNQEEGAENGALAAADDKLSSLSEDARKAAWEHDTLQLARDCAQVAKMCQAVDKSLRADCLRKITHIRAENAIGGSVVENFMDHNARHRCGTETDLLLTVDQDRFPKHSKTRGSSIPLIVVSNC